MTDTEYKPAHTFATPEEEDAAVIEWHNYDEAVEKANADFCKTMMSAAIKDIAAQYVTPLLSEGILQVSKETVQIMDMAVPRTRLPLFYISLHWVIAGVETVQGPNGYTAEKVTVIHGNDYEPGFKITSNLEADSGMSILLTRGIACEVLEIINYFVSLDTPTEKAVES